MKSKETIMKELQDGLLAFTFQKDSKGYFTPNYLS